MSKQINSNWAKLNQKIAQRRSWRWARRGLYALVFIGVFANFLANDKPYFCVYEGDWYMPVFRAVAVDFGLSSWPPDQVKRRWYNLDLKRDLWPPVPYAPGQLDLANNRFTSPFDEQSVKNIQFRHWLGTDDLGRDTLSGLIWGTRVALVIGICTMFIAGLIGLFLGSLAGFFGNDGWKLNRPQRWGGILGLLVGLYFGLMVRRPLLDMDQEVWYFFSALFIIIFATFVFSYIVNRISGRGRVLPLKAIPLDDFIMRLIELITSIPALLLLLSIVAIVPRPSLFSIIIILGLINWTGIARFVRGELLRVREMEYIQAARAMGTSPLRILWRHALPNALGPVYVAFAFGIAGTILIEAALSFLGIGIPQDIMTWGKMLRFSRLSPSAWWLAVFPGMAIFLTITIFNLLGEAITEES